jgi:hypothetical protein
MSDCDRVNWRILGILGSRRGRGGRPTVFQMPSSGGDRPARQNRDWGLEVLDKRLSVGLLGVGFIELVDYSSTKMSRWH